MLGVVPDAFGALPGLQMNGLMDQLLQFFAVTLRIGAFLMAAPFFGSRMVMLQVRIVTVVALSIFIFGQIDLPSVEVLTSPRLLPLMAQELALGLSAGLILTILFSAVSLAGEKVASTSGLSFAAQIDPTSGGQTPVISQIFTLFLTILFMAMDGHLITIALVLDSYKTIPIGGVVTLSPLVDAGLSAAGTMFEMATKIMLPIAALLLLINIAIGVITKSAPQLNLFSFGFPITLIAVYVILFISTWPLAHSFGNLIQQSMDIIETLIGGLAGG